MELRPEKKLATCQDGRQFYAANGHQYWSLYDLARGLQQMDDGTFTHHVNQHRNDFHNWVGEVVGDQTLAQGLLHLHDRDSMMRRVVLRIRFLELMKDSGNALTRANTRSTPARKPAGKPSKKTVAKKPKATASKSTATKKKTTKKPAKKATKKAAKSTSGSRKKSTKKR